MLRMVIGYARVSTDGQDESLQVDALQQAGCERIYVDRASGAIRERPELTNALRDLRDWGGRVGRVEVGSDRPKLAPPR